MATRRQIAIATAVASVLVVAGVSVWFVLRPHKPDCATVNDMLSYSKSENDRMRELIPTEVDDPQKLIDAYQERQARMHQYVNQIHDAGLREKAHTVVDLDDKILGVWLKTIPGKSDSSPDLKGAYMAYAPQRQKAAEALQAACPKP